MSDSIPSASFIDPAKSLAIISSPPICDNILSSLSELSSIQLAKSCRTAYGAVSNFNRRAYNINARLSHFFPDPDAFRSLLARTNTIISGSFALQFFNRTMYPDSDLDIYCHSMHFYEVGRWLQDLGYVFTPHHHQPDDFETAAYRIADEHDEGHMDDAIFEDPSHYPFRGISGVLNFVLEPEDESRGPLKIQLMVATRSPIEVILAFHSTCVMNLITHDRAYALYPYATFEASIALITGKRGRKITEAAIVKYRERGWKMTEVLPMYDVHFLHRLAFLRESRWIGDKCCWEISLPMDKIYTPSEQPFYLHLNGWELVYLWKGWERVWRASCLPLQSQALFYRYMLPREVFWKKFAIKWSVVEPVVSPSEEVIYEDSELGLQLNIAKIIMGEMYGKIHPQHSKGELVQQLNRLLELRVASRTLYH